ncbi:MerR family DNA-binding transcriptional regulator, partial [Candidatus Woesebacteria bacterium]|nr:MerR family DNA-binding transcriptional regulator [Candidatus Woesebacteria bacterium]
MTDQNTQYNLSPVEFARLLGVSSSTVRRWEEEGAIRSTRTSSGYRKYSLKDVERAKLYQAKTSEEKRLKGKENMMQAPIVITPSLSRARARYTYPVQIQRIILAGMVLILLVGGVLAFQFAPKDKSEDHVQGSATSTESDGEDSQTSGSSQNKNVLAAETERRLRSITSNISWKFRSQVEIQELQVEGLSVFLDDIDATGQNLTLGSGRLTASNVIYSLGVGDGLSLTGTTQNPVVSNTGVLSINGVTGSVAFTEGSGIAIDGTTIQNSGVLTLKGTGNQVEVSAEKGDITISLPQDIAPSSSPAFATINTGQGAYELFAMDQDVMTSDVVTFAGMTLQGNLLFEGATTGTSSEDAIIYYDASGEAQGNMVIAIKSNKTNAWDNDFSVDAQGNVFANSITLSGGASIAQENLTVTDSTILGTAGGTGLWNNDLTVQLGTGDFNFTYDNGSTVKNLMTFYPSAVNKILGIGNTAITTAFYSNVGIGTTAPGATLSVAGGVQIGIAGGANDILNTAVGGGVPSGVLYWGSRTLCDSSGNCAGTGAGIGGAGDANYIPLFTGTYNVGNSSLYQAGSGNIGIGTTDATSELTVDGNIAVTGTVDGRDIAADGGNIDTLYTTIGLSALTSAEVDQLENIGGSAISSTQWGYLGGTNQALASSNAVTFTTLNTGQGAYELYAMNQNVQTTDGVQFANLSLSGSTAVSSIVAGIATDWTGATDAELATRQAIKAYVEGQIGGATLSFANGLTGIGNTVTFGGSITTNTRLYSGSNELFYIDQGTSNIGIGTTDTASYKLRIEGTGYFNNLLTLNAGLNVNGQTFTSFIGTGLSNPGGVLTLTDTGVTAGTYGNATSIPVFQIDAQGRMIVAGTQPISYDNYGGWVAGAGGVYTNVGTGSTIVFAGGTGIGVTNTTGTFTITNTGVTSLAGTANQVYVGGGTDPLTGALTLTLPQSIDTGANVQFSSLTLGGIGIGGTGGAGLIGVNTAGFSNSSASILQTVLDDLDSAIGGVSGSAIDAVGNITSGDAFTSGTPGLELYFATGGTLGLGNTASGAGRIEFYDLTTDRIALMDANVGIGTTDATSKLDVQGGIRLGNNTSTANILNTISSGTAPGASLYWGSYRVCTIGDSCAGGAGGGVDSTGSAGYIAQYTDQYNIENSLLYQTGSFIGLGKTNPGYALDIAGTLNLDSGNTYKINGTDVLSSTTLGSAVVNSSLTSVGTITSGSWQGATILRNYGGTGFSSYAEGDLLVGNSSSGLNKLGIGTNGQILTSNGTAPSWNSLSSLNIISGTGSNGYLSLWNGTNTQTIASVYESSNNVGIGGTAPTVRPSLYVGANGNVGIGTTGPGSRFQIKASGTTSAGGFSVVSSTNSNNILSFQDSFAGDRGFMSIGAGGSDKIRLDSGGDSFFNSGNVGIGTTSPGAKLELAGSLLSSGVFQFGGGSSVLGYSRIGIGSTAPSTGADAGSLIDSSEDLYIAGNLHVAGSFKTPYAQTITVAKSGGDFTTINAAYTYAKTLTPSATNQILVKVMPGVYDERLTLDASYISIIGDSKDTTKMTYAASNNATATLYSNSAITGVTIANMTIETTTSGYPCYLTNANPTIYLRGNYFSDNTYFFGLMNQSSNATFDNNIMYGERTSSSAGSFTNNKITAIMGISGDTYTNNKISTASISGGTFYRNDLNVWYG